MPITAIIIYLLLNLSRQHNLAFGLLLPRAAHVEPRRKKFPFSTNALAQPTPAAVDDIRTDTLLRMIPVSNPPLLLLQSSFPIVTKEECQLLTQYFERTDTDQMAKASQTEAELILRRVQNIIDKVTNCPRHSGEMQMPRYVRYEAKATSSLEKLLSPEFVDVLLPDGLHVDTNNGKLFRHITAILYLTDNEDSFVDCSVVVGGGTTFPLAVPFGFGDEQSMSADSAAINLLERDIHHTKSVTSNDGHDLDQRRIEQSALNVFRRDTRKLLGKQTSNDTAQQANGIRVMPQAGKLIYFHNINDDGRPDPASFHGGEELAAIIDRNASDSQTNAHKSILVFFKEIPVEKIQDFDAFANEVRKARAWTKDRYYSSSSTTLVDETSRNLVIN
ncbi:hypothetical protein ACHAXN_009242 [Cyclotella atomus]